MMRRLMWQSGLWEQKPSSLPHTSSHSHLRPPHLLTRGDRQRLGQRQWAGQWWWCWTPIRTFWVPSPMCGSGGRPAWWVWAEPGDHWFYCSAGLPLMGTMAGFSAVLQHGGTSFYCALLVCGVQSLERACNHNHACHQPESYIPLPESYIHLPELYIHQSHTFIYQSHTFICQSHTFIYLNHQSPT